MKQVSQTYKQPLSADRLREVVLYDSETGVMVWRKSGRGRFKRAGVRVGRVTRYGYIETVIDGRSLLVHRLAWLYVHGEWPRLEIDHINGNKIDNRIANLRDVSSRVNKENIRSARRDSQSGLLGVSWNKAQATWVASISVGGKQVGLGCFGCKDEAHEAYLTAKRRLHQGCTI